MFKRNINMIANTLLMIPGWVILLSFLIQVYFMYGRGIAYSISENFWENIFCDSYLLKLWVPMPLLVLLSGIGIAKEDDATRYLRMGKRQTVARVNLISAFAAVVLFAFAILLIYALFFRLRNHMSLANQWSPNVLATANLEEGYGNLYPAPIVIRNFSPIGAVLMEMLFLIIYCFFLAVVSMTVNALFKQAIGSIICIFSVMVVSLFGARNYQEYSFYPLYNGSFKALTETNHFSFISYAVVYWVILLTLAVTVYYLVMRKVDLISLSREK